MIFPQKVCCSQEKTVEKKCNRFFDIYYQKVAAAIQSFHNFHILQFWPMWYLHRCVPMLQITFAKELKPHSHNYEDQRKKMTTLCIGNCSTATTLLKIWTKTICHCCSALDGCSTFLVRDIKKLIALLFHSFFLATTYFLGKIHGETKPNQIWPFSEIGMFI